MIIMRYLIILLLSFVFNLSNAQTFEECLTELTQEQIDFINENSDYLDGIDVDDFFGRRPAENIPIKIHVVYENEIRNGGDNDEPTETEIDEMIDKINESFLPVGLEFQYCDEINYIDIFDPDLGLVSPGGASNGVYPILKPGFPGHSNFEILVSSQSISGVINIFIAPTVWYQRRSGGQTATAGVATFPSLSENWIVLDSDYITTSTPSHEMGHYLNLYHTFQGPSNLIDIHDYELPGGLNCGENIGDELCDTPADPQGRDNPIGSSFSLRNCSDVSPSCQLITSGVNCALVNPGISGFYQPDPTNIMSYGHTDCRTYFSPQQIERMKKAIIAFRPDLLETTSNAFCLDCQTDLNLYLGLHWRNRVLEYEASNSITSTRVLQSVYNPGDFGANVTYDAANFICLNPGFLAEYTSTFLGIIDGCGGNFRVPKNKMAINSGFAFKVHPNPFKEQCTIVYKLQEDKSITISVLDIMGKKVSTIVNNEHRAAGEYKVQFDGSHLSTGIYYCTVQTGDKIETQKMVISK